VVVLFGGFFLKKYFVYNKIKNVKIERLKKELKLKIKN